VGRSLCRRPRQPSPSGPGASPHRSRPAAGSWLPLTPDAADLAANELQVRCHDQHFFQKLASHGIVPRDAEEAQTLLSIGENAYRMHLAELDKQADERGMFLRDAAGWVAQQAGAANSPSHIKAAAAFYASDPGLQAAAMTLTQLYDNASN
jgi:hypothetical protein